MKNMFTLNEFASFLKVELSKRLVSEKEITSLVVEDTELVVHFSLNRCDSKDDGMVEVDLLPLYQQFSAMPYSSEATGGMLEGVKEGILYCLADARESTGKTLTLNGLLNLSKEELKSMLRARMFVSGEDSVVKEMASNASACGQELVTTSITGTDLGFTYFFKFDDTSAAPITKELMNLVLDSLSREEFHDIALENAQRELPTAILDLLSVEAYTLKDLSDTDLKLVLKNKPFVIGNPDGEERTAKPTGITTIAYPGVLSRLEDAIGSFFLAPLSATEFLVYPETVDIFGSECSFHLEPFKDIVSRLRANASRHKGTDILNGEILYYSASSHKLSIV